MLSEEIKVISNTHKGRFKLAQKDDFILYGCIEQIFEESILFRTDTKTALIDISCIRTLVPLER